MSAGSGFHLDEPSIRVSWGIRQAELQVLFKSAGGEGVLRLVTEGYYTTPCRALCGLATQIGFHFHPRSTEGVLAELEFFDNGRRELEASYELYQKHLELAFGRPWASRRGTYAPDLRWHKWRKGRLRIEHYVMDRFGPEEHVRIVRKGWLESVLP